MESMGKEVGLDSRNELYYRSGNSAFNDPADAAERKHNNRERPKG